MTDDQIRFIYKNYNFMKPAKIASALDLKYDTVSKFMKRAQLKPESQFEYIAYAENDEIVACSDSLKNLAELTGYNCDSMRSIVSRKESIKIFKKSCKIHKIRVC